MELLSLGVNAPSGNRGRSRTARALYSPLFDPKLVGLPSVAAGTERTAAKL